MPQPVGGDAMRPFPYHFDVAELLRREEPHLWQWMAGGRIEAQSQQLRHDLLRSTHRLDRDGHPQVVDAARRAAAAVGVTVPVAVYQAEGETAPNASLIFVPDEAIVLLAGPIAALLDAAELTAVLGHELAHHTLWTLDGGEHLVADRLVNAMVNDGGAAAVAETARRLALTTELFADRGALQACGDLHTTVAALVKVATGMRSVSPASYLRQADEVLRAETTATSAPTHPETFMRVIALRDWAGDGDVDHVDRLVHGDADIDRLDLIEQAHLAALSRQAIDRMLEPDWMRTDAVLGHARTYFPDAGAPADVGDAVGGRPLADSARRYLAYVLLDLVAADADLDHQSREHAVSVAFAMGVGTEFEALVARELGAR